MDTVQEEKAKITVAKEANHRFSESLVNWGALEKFGISRDYLLQKGYLDDMLRGNRTRDAVPVNMNLGSVAVKMDAQLFFQQGKDGEVVLAVSGVRQKPNLDRPYFGHVFSEEDRQNLRETGNMGRLATLAFRNGEKADYVVSVNPVTNEIMATRADKMFIPKELCGVKLSEHEQDELKAGRAILLEGMTGSKGEFDARLQLSAVKRGVEFKFVNSFADKHEIGGVKLTDKQFNELTSGKAILVEDMQRRNGETFSSFVKLADGMPTYSRFNPDSPEGAREVVIPREILGVRLEPQDREALKAGQPIFVNGMIGRNGKEFDSFVKIDAETGDVRYSRSRDFEVVERPKADIPQELRGVKLTTAERAALQDGRTVQVKGMKGFDGQKIDMYVRVNASTGNLDFTRNNPDMKKDSKENANPQKAEQKKEARGAKADVNKTAKRSRKIS